MSHINTITLKPEGKIIALLTSTPRYRVDARFEINTALLSAFLAGENEAFYDFDESFALRIYRISDSSISLHLTWVTYDVIEAAYQQSFILPVALVQRAIGGKTVNVVVDQHFDAYDVAAAREMVLPRGIIKAYVGA